MRSALVVLMAVVLGMNGYCAKAQDDSRRALAEELLNEMHMKENIEKSMAMMKKMMPAMARTARATETTPTPPGETKAGENANQEKADQVASKMMDQMAEEMTWDNMKDDYITLYAETFSEEELKGLVVFYKSPVGQAFVMKQPELMKRSMELMQKRMWQWMPKLRELSKGMMPQPPRKAEEVAPPPAATPPVPPAVKP